LTVYIGVWERNGGEIRKGAEYGRGRCGVVAEGGPDGWMDGLDSTVPFPSIREVKRMRAISGRW